MLLVCQKSKLRDSIPKAGVRRGQDLVEDVLLHLGLGLDQGLLLAELGGELQLLPGVGLLHGDEESFKRRFAKIALITKKAPPRIFSWLK